MGINHEAVQGSSHIKSIGYDETTRELQVHFHGTGIYSYPGVHPSTHRTLMGSPSKGEFLSRYIKPHHHGTKL